MIEISVQKAKQGDSIWIRCLSDENVVNIVIDAGPSTFQNGFKNMVKEIKEKKERINLLIFSHIDDDLNVLSFIDVLRTIISKTNWQIIISTHEENFYEIMKVKLSSEYYNSKFFVFQSEGKIIQDK